MLYENGIVCLIAHGKYKLKLSLVVQMFDCSPADDEQVLYSCVFPASAQ